MESYYCIMYIYIFSKQHGFSMCCSYQHSHIQTHVYSFVLLLCCFLIVCLSMSVTALYECINICIVVLLFLLHCLLCVQHVCAATRYPSLSLSPSCLLASFHSKAALKTNSQAHQPTNQQTNKQTKQAHDVRLIRSRLVWSKSDLSSQSARIMRSIDNVLLSFFFKSKNTQTFGSDIIVSILYTTDTHIV